MGFGPPRLTPPPIAGLRDASGSARVVSGMAVAAVEETVLLRENVGGVSERIRRNAAELPVEPDLAQRGGTSKLIVGDVVDL